MYSRLILFVVLCFSVSLSGFGKRAVSESVKEGKDTVRKVVELKEVTVYSPYSANKKGNLYQYTPQQAGMSISVVGEPDVLRHISSLPGVSQGIESSLGLFVRGANTGSNGLYFNDLPLYVSSHMMGIVSVYPSEIIENVKFYMGGFSAGRGNQSSSVLDVAAKHDYGGKTRGAFSLSPYLSGLYSSVPVIKDKLSVQIAARGSFAPYLINQFYIDRDELGIDVFDITLLADYKASDRNYFDLMYFRTNDYLSSNGEFHGLSQNWRSENVKGGWKSILNEKWNLKCTAYYVDAVSAQQNESYNTYNDNKKTISLLGMSSGLKEFSFKGSLDYRHNERLSGTGGIEYQNQFFVPGRWKYVSGEENKENKAEEYLNIFSAFANTEFMIPEKLDLTLGYRQTFYAQEREVGTGWDLHLLTHWYLSDRFGVEVTADRINQYYHVLEGLPTGWSMNIMVPSSKNYKPELTNQAYTGLFWNKSIGNISANISLGGYYRDMRNIVMYKNPVNAFGFESTSWKEQVAVGKGSSRGLELAASVEGGRFGATLAYTLSKTDRTFAEINHGETFPFKFDRRQILNVQTKWTFAKFRKPSGVITEHTFTGAFNYSSGNRATLVVGQYPGETPPYWEWGMDSWNFPVEFYDQIYDRQLMSSVNGYVMKDYSRLDAAYTYKRIGGRFTNEFSVSVFNITNRHNPYMYFCENGQWKQLSLVPIMPSIRWAIYW